MPEAFLGTSMAPTIAPAKPVQVEDESLADLEQMAGLQRKSGFSVAQIFAMIVAILPTCVAADSAISCTRSLLLSNLPTTFAPLTPLPRGAASR